MTISELNACDRERFVDTLGWIFEDSPWVAERAHSLGPFTDRDDLHRAMQIIVEQAAADEQLALLRAHPDLGTRLAMSGASTQEQAGAGLASLPPEQRARLAALNSRYRERFGFPFLFAVRGATGGAVLASIESRVERSPDEELAEALRQVFRIARFRLHDAVTEEQ